MLKQPNSSTTGTVRQRDLGDDLLAALSDVSDETTANSTEATIKDEEKVFAVEDILSNDDLVWERFMPWNPSSKEKERGNVQAEDLDEKVERTLPISKEMF